MTAQNKSFGKGLFFGVLREEMVFPYPAPPRIEQELVSQLLRRFHDFRRSAIDPRQIDADAAIPRDLLAGLGNLGLLGLSLPPAYGGQGLSNTSACRILQEIAGVDMSIAATLLAHNLGTSGIARYGTEEQRRRFLPDLAAGRRLCAFCLTESTSGSDAASIRTRAEPVADGFILNGSKTWVTNGGTADVFLVFAQTEVVRDGARLDRITGFITERGPGVRSGAQERTLGVRGASTTALYLDDLQVPRDAVLSALGGGFKLAMEIRDAGRLPLAATCIGAAREALRLSLQHATSRRQFGRLISSFGLIKDKLAQMQIDLYAAESMVYLTAGLLDRSQRILNPSRPPAGSIPPFSLGGRDPLTGIDASLETACCKVFASEMLHRVVSEAMQIAAGASFTADYPYERYLRDGRFPLTFEATSEVLRCYIALTGMAGPGEQLAKLSDAIKFPLRGYGLVVDTIMEKVRVAAYGGPAMTLHHPRLKKEAVNIEDTLEALAKGIDRSLRRHGRQISEAQYVQRRVADVIIDVFAMIACVSRCSAQLVRHDARLAAGGGLEAAGQLDTADRELRLCQGFCNRAMIRIAHTLERFNDNDDELMKAIADDSYHGQPYPFDAVLGDR